MPLLITLGLVAIPPEVPARAQSAALVVECNRLATVVNRNQDIVADFEAAIDAYSQTMTQAETLDDIKSAARQYVDAIATTTDALDGLTTDLEALPLQDSQLSTYRDQYATVVRGVNGALIQAGEAMEEVVDIESEADLPEHIEATQTATLSAVEQIEALAGEESSIVEQINTYCGATP